MFSFSPHVFGLPVFEGPRVYVSGSDIPDVQNPPMSFPQTVSDSAITSLESVQVGLHLSGNPSGSGFASEMYVALIRDLTQTSILLNQVGITATDPVGSHYDGWNVLFSEAGAMGDIHSSSLDSGVLSGTWEPDGRTDPTSDSRPQTLSVFDGLSGNGEWRLVVGDMGAGGTMRLESWSLTFSGQSSLYSMPEGGGTLPLLGLAFLGLGLICRGVRPPLSQTDLGEVKRALSGAGRR